MKVLVIPSWYPQDVNDPGGSFFREQAIGLQRAGVEVAVLALRPPSMRFWERESFFVPPSQIVDEGVLTHRGFPTNWLPRTHIGLRSAWEWAGLRHYDQICQWFGRPDIIHVHAMLYAGALARRISMKYGIPYIVTEHSSAYGQGLLSKAQLDLAARIAGQAERRLAVSPYFANTLASVCPESGQWSVIPNIVSDRFFEDVQPAPGAGFRFCAVNNLRPLKRVDLILAAFAQRFAGRPGVSLDIAGDGPERTRLERMARDLRVADQVTFLGALSRDEVKVLMQQSNAFVLASDKETFGVVVVEALAQGRPVVVTRCGGPDDVVTSKDGILVPPGDASALAAGMAEIMARYEDFCPQELSARTRERFGSQTICGRIIAEYRAVLDGR